MFIQRNVVGFSVEKNLEKKDEKVIKFQRSLFNFLHDVQFNVELM